MFVAVSVIPGMKMQRDFRGSVESNQLWVQFGKVLSFDNLREKAPGDQCCIDLKRIAVLTHVHIFVRTCNTRDVCPVHMCSST